MRNTKYYIAIFLALGLIFTSCQEDEVFLEDVVAPSNLTVTAEIVGADDANPNGDGSGTVNFTAEANNALSYKYVYNGEESLASSGVKIYNFSVTGVSDYFITVLAIGEGGVTSSTTIEVRVLATYTAPTDLLEMLVGDDSRTWRLKSEAANHFGLGPVGGNIPSEWFGVAADEKSGVGMYDDRFIFNKDGTFTHITNTFNDDPSENNEGTVFGREILIDELQGLGQGIANGADIENYPFDDYVSSWSLSAPNDVETLSLSGTAFISYYIGGNHKYQIFSRTETEMIIKTTDGNSEFDWWFILTNQEEVEETVAEEFESEFNTLFWSDEFETAGAPDNASWTYDLGAGGWGNGESQTYTDNAENVIVEDGSLKIMAKADGLGGYTSARLKSQGLFDFKYGRVEVRAKLPAAQGTWPAIWMLGSNIEDVNWPACGEIDIMEQTGWDKTITSAAMHFPGNSGGDAPTNSVDNETSTTEFHNYVVDWTEDEINILVDDEVFFTQANSSDSVFNLDFFLIMNIAMGGTLGGDIDPAFTEDTMEIDYVRVYQ